MGLAVPSREVDLPAFWRASAALQSPWINHYVFYGWLIAMISNAVVVLIDGWRLFRFARNRGPAKA
jgi:hypothetical protein